MYLMIVDRSWISKMLEEVSKLGYHLHVTEDVKFDTEAQFWHMTKSLVPEKELWEIQEYRGFVLAGSINGSLEKISERTGQSKEEVWKETCEEIKDANRLGLINPEYPTAFERD